MHSRGILERYSVQGSPSKTRLIGDLIRLRRPVHRTTPKIHGILPYDAPSEALLPIVILVAYVRNTQCSRVLAIFPIASTCLCQVYPLCSHLIF